MEGGQRHVGELGEMSKEEETFKEVLKISHSAIVTLFLKVRTVF